MNHVVCLFEESGLSAKDWSLNGYDVFCYDISHKKTVCRYNSNGCTVYMHWDATNPKDTEDLVQRHKGHTAMLLSFPPCTDLAVSGAKHFASKAKRNPNYQRDALWMVLQGRVIAELIGCPYAIENPIGVVSTMWRKPDYIFNPWEYGGYLPEDDVHPLYPQYIPPRDAYPKKTCYWTGGGFRMPHVNPVEKPPGYSDMYHNLGGRSARTKRIRAVSPRGIARAVFLSNSKGLK